MIYHHNRVFTNIEVREILEDNEDDKCFLCIAYNEYSRATVQVKFHKSKTSLLGKLKNTEKYYIEGYLSSEDGVTIIRLEKVKPIRKNGNEFIGFHYCFKLVGITQNKSDKFISLTCEPISDTLNISSIKMICKKDLYNNILKQVEGHPYKLVYVVSHLMNSSQDDKRGLNIKLPFIVAKAIIL